MFIFQIYTNTRERGSVPPYPKMAVPFLSGSAFDKQYFLKFHSGTVHGLLYQLWVECDKLAASDKQMSIFSCWILTSTYTNINVRTIVCVCWLLKWDSHNRRTSTHSSTYSSAYRQKLIEQMCIYVYVCIHFSLYTSLEPLPQSLPLSLLTNCLKTNGH